MNFVKKIIPVILLMITCMTAYAYPEDSVLNVSDMTPGAITTVSEFNGFTVLPAVEGGAVTIDKSSKSSAVTGNKYTKRLKLAGDGSLNSRAVTFTVSEPATFIIEATSSNSSSDRTGVVADSNGDTISSNVFSSGLSYYKTSLPQAGSYTFYSIGGGINIYYMCLTYAPQEPEPDYDFEDLTGSVMSRSDTIYTAPKADPNGKGTKDEPMSIASAVLNIAPGGTIYCDGVYQFNDCLTIDTNNCGEDGRMKKIQCSEGTVFDFSGEPYSTTVSKNARGVQINGNYWYIYGLEVYMAADNGFFIAGKHNTLEMCIANGNRDTGIQISRRASTVSDYKDWPSDNLILNCTSFNSFDPATGENADGFAAKLTCGDNNVFDGCIAYNNCDDGWDCFTKDATGPIGSLVMKNCVAFRSGQTTDGIFTENCDGNGFKMGGSKIAVDHTLINCIAFENKNHGFTDNSNPGKITLMNCTAFNNAVEGGTKKSNFDFARDKQNSNNTLINCLSYTDNKIASDKFIGSVTNSALYNNKPFYAYFEKLPYTNWNNKEGVQLPTETMEAVSSSTFVSVQAPELGANVHKLWRNADGSVNMGNFLKVADNTSYKNLGIGADLSGEPIILPTASPSPEPTSEPSPDVTAEPSASPEATAEPSEAPVSPQPTNPPYGYKLAAAESDRAERVIDAEFTNYTDNLIEPYVIFAVYKNTDGREVLAGFYGENITVDAGCSEIVSCAEFTDIEYDTAKIFAWTDNMLPLTSAAQVQILFAAAGSGT